MTYFLVNIIWVFFRAQDFAAAWRMIISMLLIDRSGEPVLATVYIVETILVIGLMLVVHWRVRNTSVEAVVGRIPVWLIGVVWGLMAFAIVTTQGEGNAFIYFQF